LRYDTFVGRDVIMDDEDGKESADEGKETADEGKETEDEDEEEKGTCGGESVEMDQTK
jgi:hypothetical protein